MNSFFSFPSSGFRENSLFASTGEVERELEYRFPFLGFEAGSIRKDGMRGSHKEMADGICVCRRRRGARSTVTAAGQESSNEGRATTMMGKAACP